MIILRILSVVIVWVIVSTGCANYGAYQQRKAERAQQKILREREKEMEKSRHRHYEMQHPDVQKRMKESEKRFRRYQRQRNRRPLWDRIFR